jgi:L-ascorbate metabolism protein UlaG (beta-lactamase superfamily)
MNKVTYISNAGVLLEMGGKKILIDSLCDSTVAIYKKIPEDLERKIIEGVSPYDQIDLILFTHHHPDHFKAQTTAAFMKGQARPILVSTEETVKRLTRQEPALDQERLIVPDLKLGESKVMDINGIHLELVSMLHDGKDYKDVENFAFLIEVDGSRVLHVGDAKPMKENYEHLNLADRPVDLLLAPFPNVGIPSGQGIIKDLIKPKKVAALHLPYEDKDRFNWIAGTKKSHGRIKEAFVDTVFLEEIGDQTEF